MINDKYETGFASTVVLTPCKSNPDRILREYLDIVDVYNINVDREKDIGRVKGVIYTVIPKNEIKQFGSGFVARNIMRGFDFGTQSITKTDKLWGRFIPRPQSVERVKCDLNSLLIYIQWSILPIIWKEDEHGYEIDKDGVIKRAWKLLPF